MKSDICRWGILGTAGIARKNWRAILNTGNGTLVAVASRTADRAAKYVAECQADSPFPTSPEPVGSYEELLARPDIDAVYVPLPTGIRKEWVIRAAQAGKHVMCEKPCGVHAREVEEILDACRKANVQFMDGVMFMHTQRLQRMRDILDDGTSVGEIRRISSRFSFRAPDEFLQTNIRVSNELEPLGCLGDLGWYNIRFALWAMKYALPSTVTGRILVAHGRGDSSAPVPIEFSGELVFPGGASSEFFCSFIATHDQMAAISGTKGYLHLSDFVLPFNGAETVFSIEQTEFVQRGCTFEKLRHPRQITQAEHSHGHADAQETNLFRRFGELALGGKPDPFWGDVALRTQQVVDACLESALKGGAEVSPG
ncbi:MAG: Gfo/Idh/MocA family oxidoreductase [Planctomycetaceae bacterium]|nr:Gfo/Idh/MocA family oxidoreductase [Planctomycetaceae bacterium]